MASASDHPGFTVNKDKEDKEESKKKGLKDGEKDSEQDEDKKEPEKAISLHTGGDLKIQKSIPGGKPGAVVSSQYVGVGPLLIPSTRGEQKAISGDVAIEFYIDNEDPALDQRFVIVMPYALADALGFLSGGAATHEEWSKFQDERAKRQADADAKRRSEIETRQAIERGREIDTDRSSTPSTLDRQIGTSSQIASAQSTAAQRQSAHKTS